jgi:hypothetical protein
LSKERRVVEAQILEERQKALSSPPTSSYFVIFKCARSAALFCGFAV